MMRLLPRRLAPRLVLATMVFVVLGWAISDVSNLMHLEDRLLEERIAAAEQLSTSITSATWHAMLAGHKDDAYAVMQVMGDHQGVEWIRIFAKMGRVAYSSDPSGPRMVAIEADECRVCHDVEPARLALSREERVRLWKNEAGPPQPGHAHADPQRARVLDRGVPRARSRRPCPRDPRCRHGAR